jgi:hypothetical protein
VLASAIARATWNLLAKRSGDSLVFGWWQCLVGAAFLEPLALVAALSTPVPAAGLPYLGLTVLLHCVYFGALAQAYRLGEPVRGKRLAGAALIALRAVAIALAALYASVTSLFCLHCGYFVKIP